MGYRRRSTWQTVSWPCPCTNMGTISSLAQGICLNRAQTVGNTTLSTYLWRKALMIQVRVCLREGGGWGVMIKYHLPCTKLLRIHSSLSDTLGSYGSITNYTQRNIQTPRIQGSRNIACGNWSDFHHWEIKQLTNHQGLKQANSKACQRYSGIQYMYVCHVWSIIAKHNPRIFVFCCSVHADI